MLGRKHQLRIHCAEALGRPIIGDSVHGMVRSPTQRQLRKLARSAAPFALSVPESSHQLLQLAPGEPCLPGRLPSGVFSPESSGAPSVHLTGSNDQSSQPFSAGSNISEASSAHSAQRELDQLQSARDSAAAASNRLAVNSDHIIANCKNMGLYQLQRPQEPARVSGSSALENLTSCHESAEHSNQDTLLSNASTAWTNGQQNGRPAEPVAAPTVAVSMPVPAGASGSSADLMLHARTLCISRPGQVRASQSCASWQMQGRLSNHRDVCFSACLCRESDVLCSWSQSV